jgi:hypothetical protein
MDPQDLARFETDAAEIVGAMKELFAEFEKRLGEVVSAQRVAASETRAEGAHVTQQLQELGRFAKSLVGEQRNLLTRIDREWQMHIDSNAQRAGEAQAKAFGESIAQGLHEQLAELATQVEASTRRLTWKTSLRWALGIAIAIPLAINLGVQAIAPSVEKLSVSGLTPEQTRDALSKLVPCHPEKNNWRDWHICIAVDAPPSLVRGASGEALVVVRGM